MKPQFITTEAGEELVVLTRRDYDALLAAAGDEEAEDRMTLVLAAEARERPAGEALLPGWLVEAVAAGDTPVRAARRRAGLTQVALARAAGLGQGYVSELERGAKRASPEALERIARATGLDPAVLASARF
jgi:DNA-binding XRE family transcriptional regulator